MSLEITGAVQLTSSKNAAPLVGIPSSSWRIDQSGFNSVDTVRTLSTSSIQLSLTGISEVNLVAVQNYAAVGSLQDTLVSWDDSAFDIRCPAGASILAGAPVGTTTCYVKSRSGAPKTRVVVLPV